MIDFDYNATTPLKETVHRAMEPFLDGKYGNPSSIHGIGQQTKAAVEEAREAIARSINANPESLVLTGSGSEANTMALRGSLNPPHSGRTVLTTPVEHSSVKDTAEWMATNGVTVKRVPMLEDGQIDLEQFRELIDESVDLVSVMSVNNETGIVYPVEDIACVARSHGVTVHTDAVQAYGKTSLDFSNISVDMLSISAHKVGGPKGVGALVAPKDMDLVPLIFGGHQERDRRGGTENVPGVVGFGRAASEINLEAFRPIRERRDRFEDYLDDNLDGFKIVGKQTERVGNTSGLLIKGVKGEDVVVRMDMKGYATATGAACTSGSSQPSHVIQALPIPDDYSANSFVRLSFSPEQSMETLLEGARALISVVKELRTVSVTEKWNRGMVTQP